MEKNLKILDCDLVSGNAIYMYLFYFSYDGVSIFRPFLLTEALPLYALMVMYKIVSGKQLSNHSSHQKRCFFLLYPVSQWLKIKFSSIFEFASRYLTNPLSNSNVVILLPFGLFPLAE